MTLEAGFFILILCLLAIIVRLVVRLMRADDNPMNIQIVKCSGDCGKKVMLVGRKQQFGECVFCDRCQAMIQGGQSGGTVDNSGRS